jgi:GDP-4-dehydro-6-deoxy-D-mannose reductase
VSSVPLRVLVTGSDGFVGRHLIATIAVLDDQHTIIAGSNGEGAERSAGSRVVAFDVTDDRQVRDIIARERPTHLVHLAAMTAVPAAQDNIRRAWDVNLGGTLNVALALLDAAPECRLLHCSSAEVYGDSFRAGVPLDETARLEPLNAYGATKAAADLMIGQMARHGLRAIRLRPFNHTGPGQSENFVIASFAAQIARIEQGLQPPLMKVGNLGSRRDFLDVRDVIDLYVRAIMRFDDIPLGSALNIASGQSYAIGDILAMLLSLSSHSIEVMQDPARARSAETDASVSVGDSSLARRVLGWQPRFSIRDTLQSVLDYFRGATRRL